MERTTTNRIGRAVLVAAVIAFGGCAEGPVQIDPALIAQFRETLLLPEEPADALTPLDWIERSEEPTEGEELAEEVTLPSVGGEEMVLVGQIGGMPNPWPDTETGFPWREGEATFFLVDPSTVAEFDDHLEDKGEDHAANCPFCAREAARKASSIAAVSLVDESGDTIAIDARKLLGVEAGDVVIVRGKRRSTSGDFLVVDAQGVYIRR